MKYMCKKVVMIIRAIVTLNNTSKWVCNVLYIAIHLLDRKRIFLGFWKIKNINRMRRDYLHRPTTSESRSKSFCIGCRSNLYENVWVFDTAYQNTLI